MSARVDQVGWALVGPRQEFLIVDEAFSEGHALEQHIINAGFSQGEGLLLVIGRACDLVLLVDQTGRKVCAVLGQLDEEDCLFLAQC